MMPNALEIDDLVMHYDTPAGLLQAVRGVSLHVPDGETLGLVGESGCGKSTLARCVVGLNRPTSGTVRIAGDMPGKTLADRRRMARNVQMIFQDPMSSLNPRLTIARIVEQPLKVHGIGDAAERHRRVVDLLDKVGLGSHFLERYPHELSGGQRQRASIARALALDPRLIVCDESVSALDVSIQAQVLNLLTALQKDLGVALLFISHDLAVVRYVSHRIAVMYLGRIVELGDAESVWHRPLHPYTRALMDSIPSGEAKARNHLVGDVPSAVRVPSGCAFRTRCPHAQAICAERMPELDATGRHHAVACHLADSLPAHVPAGQVEAAAG